MATSQEIMQQMEAMGELPDFKTQITQEYEKPVLRPIVNERASLEEQYLPTVFKSFTGGTSAADMSPAAKLAMMGGNLGRLTSKIGANQDIQNFYGMQIDNLARQNADNWNNRYSKLRDLYGMSFQREEAERAAAERAAARAAQQAASMQQQSSLQELLNSSQAARQAAGQFNQGLEIELGKPRNYEEYKARMNARGLNPRSPRMSENYYNNTYRGSLETILANDPLKRRAFEASKTGDLGELVRVGAEKKNVPWLGNILSSIF